MVVKRISTSVTPEMYDLAKKYNIPFSFALHKGLVMLLAERGVGDFTNERNVNLIIQQREAEIKELNDVITVMRGKIFDLRHGEKKEKGEKKEN